MTEEQIRLDQVQRLEAVKCDGRDGRPSNLLGQLDSAHQMSAPIGMQPGENDSHISAALREQSGWEEKVYALAERTQSIIRGMVMALKPELAGKYGAEELPTISEFTEVFSELHPVFEPSNEAGAFYRDIIEKAFDELGLEIVPPERLEERGQQPEGGFRGRLAARPQGIRQEGREDRPR